MNLTSIDDMIDKTCRSSGTPWRRPACRSAVYRNAYRNAFRSHYDNFQRRETISPVFETVSPFDKLEILPIYHLNLRNTLEKRVSSTGSFGKQ
ncbi:hypothetical protein E2C01_046573 [Portunus trituberculatus]|uniref:Uncharacterized protein n=1 Tax=Portunus trituberculatus TaxID=210409 RepID=A0A5B7G572_PORTR|nr:hypothetical protein [Portunus trituberculatus]